MSTCRLGQFNCYPKNIETVPCLPDDVFDEPDTRELYLKFEFDEFDPDNTKGDCTDANQEHSNMSGDEVQVVGEEEGDL